jgi:hypothetical protein
MSAVNGAFMSMNTKNGRPFRWLLRGVHKQSANGASIAAERVVVGLARFVNHALTPATLGFHGEYLAGRPMRRLELHMLDTAQRRLLVEPADLAIKPGEDSGDPDLVAGALKLIRALEPLYERIRHSEAWISLATSHAKLIR